MKHSKSFTIRIAKVFGQIVYGREIGKMYIPSNAIGKRPVKMSVADIIVVKL